MPIRKDLTPTMTTQTGAYSVLTLEAALEDGESLADWARRAFGIEPVRLEKPGETRTWLDLYFEDDVRALLAARVAARRPEVRGHALRLCRPRDWQRFWQRHFPVTRISRRLRIVPVWKRGRVRFLCGVRDLLIHPGLSFGTGTHFTTRFCLERIDVLCGGRRPASLLDIGAGSGILAIAAAKLGVQRVAAIDHDAQALEQARENLRVNRVARRVRLAVADIAREPPPGRFEVIVANLYGGLLLQCAPAIAAACGRHLVLSGIREVEADAVAEGFEAQGFEETLRDGDGEWCGMEFQRKQQLANSNPQTSETHHPKGRNGGAGGSPFFIDVSCGD